MDINQKFKKVLELQEQGVPRTEIYKHCEWSSLDTLTRTMKKRGFVYDKIQEKYIHMSDVGQVSPTTKTAIKTVENNSVADLKDNVLKKNITTLMQRYQEIIEVLEWYKTDRGQVSSNKNQVIEVVNKGIQINLPRCASIKTSIRVNQDIWKQFKAFSEEHNEFVKGDLLAQALKEYMDKNN